MSCCGLLRQPRTLDLLFPDATMYIHNDACTFFSRGGGAPAGLIMGLGSTEA
jgi:hypothetical protein